MTLPALKADDEVQLTLRGKVTSVDATFIGIKFPGRKLDESEYCFEVSELTAPTARVEVLPPPIEVGDVVRFKGCPAPVKVLAIAGREAWLDVLHMQRPIHNLCDLTLVSKASKAGGRV